MTDVIKTSQKLHIIKNIALMSVAEKRQIKKSEKNIMQKKKDYLVKKEFAKIVDVKIL
jgi:hypothetical protein